MIKHRVRTIVLSAVAIGALGAGSAHADEKLNAILKLDSQSNKVAQESQAKIEKISEQTDSLLSKYKLVLKDVDALRVYNAQVEKLISNQQAEMADLNDSIARVTYVERQIMPLMIRMVDALEKFIELDVPFQKDVRRAGVQRLRDLIDRSDVDASEKFRNVLEAYQIESAYGRTFESYEGSVEVNGVDQQVSFLQIGRIALLYQTPDGSVSGAWNQQTGQWEILSDKYGNQIDQGLKVARKQAAADRLLLLPVAAPEVSQ